MSERPAGPLDGVRVVDLTDERAIYGAKLLADLGAEVVRAEPPGGDPLRARGPHAPGADGEPRSLWHALFASNRRFATVDLDDAAGRAALDRLCAGADVVLATDHLPGGAPDVEALLARRPDLVVVRVRSFGPEGPWRDALAPDLVAGALGGLVATTGEADTPPLKCFGDLNFVIPGCYAAIAALAALGHARETGEGQLVEVSVHETIASCLEHVLMFHWYRDGAVLRRQGSLHWSGAYQVMAARDGHVMVTPTPDLQRQVAWLVEEGAHGDLLDPAHLETPAALLPVLMERLRAWVATKDVEPFFFEAQRRHHPYGWVLPVEALLASPQLAAREWWEAYDVGGREVRGPGAPYDLSETPWRPPAPASAPVDAATLLDEIGWGR